MKKIIALMLCLMLALSMSVTAFAEGEQTGTTTLTVEVTEHSPSYTIHIPANTTLEYGKEEQAITGSLYVSDVKNLSASASINCDVYASALQNGSNNIKVAYLYCFNDNDSNPDFSSYSEEYVYDESILIVECWDLNLDNFWKFGIRVEEEDWDDATPGTYTATMTFNFSISE